jgi:hypothetical protein
MTAKRSVNIEKKIWMKQAFSSKSIPFTLHLDEISFFIIPEEKATETISDDSLGRFSTAKPQIQKN